MTCRTCPNCDFQNPIGKHLSMHFFQGVFASWKCKRCKATLVISVQRRILLAVLGVGPVGFLPHLADHFMAYHLEATISWILAMIILAGWALYVFSFDLYHLKEQQILPHDPE